MGVIHVISHKNKNAFTLIEVIVVLALISILSLIAAPTVTAYISEAKSAVCRENRNMLMRMYKSHIIIHPEEDFVTFLASSCDEEDFCPDGGEYYYEEGKVLCTYHNQDEENEDEEDPSPEDSGIINFPDNHQALASSSWNEVLEAADLAGGGVTVSKGNVYYDEPGEFYVMKSQEWISTGTELSTYDRAAKIKTDSLLTPDDVSEEGWIHWVREFLLTEGMVRLHTDGRLYAYVGDTVMSTSTWAAIDDNWVLLVSP